MTVITSELDVREPAAPPGATAVLVLADGSLVWGRGLGAARTAVGEICFNTSMTGYQEILTDPSYAGQIVTFTFPHIGNVGANLEDVESSGAAAARACILRMGITEPSNYRAARHFDDWLKARDLVGIAGVDTRALTRRIRDRGAPNGVLACDPHGRFDLAALRAQAAAWPGLEGMDLALEASCTQTYRWDQSRWAWNRGYGTLTEPKRHVVAIDYGAKHNILRCLADLGCAVTVVPATATAEEVMGHEPDGIFLANGPGDPAATGVYAVPVIQALMESGKPMFGICLGHQLLARAVGARTSKMANGHRGANHPVKDLATGIVEITSQNHGFVVEAGSLPAEAELTHISLFDGSVEGFRLKDRPVFAVQYHPEASPGPHDSHYLFKRFVALIDG
ncbi:MAG: glutamine-hydrolyzing carbamoyl-phosphate synthase small subunit [Alphaproteobacteria bacterium]